MRTPLGLVKMCTLPQGATNSVAHMQNAMNLILQKFIPEKTRPFLDDVPIKGCLEGKKDETKRDDGVRQFVYEHMCDVEAILQRLIEAHITFSGEKSSFGQREITVVGQRCGPQGRRPSDTKVEVIRQIGDCKSLTEVRRFLGACIFYRSWIPHFAHIAEPLYNLQRKGRKFIWTEKHTEAMDKLKAALMSPLVLRPIDYTCGRPVILTVDSSPTAAGWAVGQDNEEGRRFATRFGAKIFAERQRKYSQVKRELWGATCALKQERDYLIGAYVVLETDCLPLLGMIANCDTPDIAMLRWIAFIRLLNPELKHIAG
jgi:RNase H-like domain found in reverse transcriptase